MEVLQTIMTHRRVRKFERQQIPDAYLVQILRAGMYTRSGTSPSIHEKSPITV